jgi:hypothetical protein
MRFGVDGRVVALIAACAVVACGERETLDSVGQNEPAAEISEIEAAPAHLEAHDDAPAEETEAEDEIPAPLFPRGLVAQEPGVSAGYVLFNPLLSDTT